MSRWFRFYDDAINDPKILRLAPDAFRSWVFLLCVASKSGGKLPPIDDVAFYLRTKPQRAAAILAQLVAAGLIDKTEDGFEPHNWSGRQYLSDTSKERVQRHRNKRAAAGLIPQWTAPAALRKAVYAADDHECVYCGSSEFLSIDHKTSELNGGTHDFDNLVTACRSCNGAKRDMSFDEYVTKTKIETLHGRYLKRPQTTDNRTEQTTEQKSSLRSETRAARATRLPDDWIPSEADLAFAVSRGLSIAQIETEALKFRNHWTSKSGKDATKTNWSRTWENWILNIRGAPNHGNRTGNPRTSGHDAILAVAARKASQLNRNDEMAGPAGTPGFAFGEGVDAGGPDRGRGAAEAGRGDRQRQEPDDQRIREGEIIPPDKDAAGIPRGRQFV